MFKMSLKLLFSTDTVGFAKCLELAQILLKCKQILESRDPENSKIIKKKQKKTASVWKKTDFEKFLTKCNANPSSKQTDHLRINKRF